MGRRGLAFGVLLAGACAGDHIGDGEPADPVCQDEVGSAPLGIFSTAQSFPQDGCNTASLEGFDLSGLWYLYSPGDFTSSPVRISQSCTEGTAATIGRITAASPVDYSSTADGGLFLYSRIAGEFSQVDAYNVCAVTSSGSLYGHLAKCFENSESEFLYCETGEFEMQPFTALEEEPSRGLQLVGEFAGASDAPWPDAFTANVAVRQGVAYVARGTDGLRLVDIDDPASPSELGHYEINLGESQGFADALNDIAIVEGADGKLYALLAGNYSGMHVVDVTDPAAPVLVDIVNPFGNFSGVHRLVVETVDGVVRAYLTDGVAARLVIVDVTNPAASTQIGQYTASDSEWSFHAASADNGRIYVNATVGGMIVLDTLDDPAAPTFLGRFPSADYSHASAPARVGGRELVVHTAEGYGAHAKVVDANPASGTFLEVVGEYATRDEVSIHNLIVKGSTAYLAYYQDGVRVVDLSDPESPVETAFYNTWSPETASGAALEGAVDLEVDEEAGLIYVADTPRGLLILRMD